MTTCAKIVCVVLLFASSRREIPSPKGKTSHKTKNVNLFDQALIQQQS